MDTWIAGNLTDMRTQIAQVDGLYMSSEFAAKVKHSNAGLALHKAQLRATETSLARIKCRHVFHLMYLPEELRRIILVMVVKEEAGHSSLCGHYDLPAIAATGNKQLSLETVLAALQNIPVCANWNPESLVKWLSTVNFSLLRQAGITSTQNGFSAVRSAEIIRRDGPAKHQWSIPRRLLSRFKNLQHLTVPCPSAILMFGIGSDSNLAGEELGASVRECNLDLPRFNLRNLKKLTVILTFKGWNERGDWQYSIARDIPEWRAIIEHGCQKVAGWLAQE